MDNNEDGYYSANTSMMSLNEEKEIPTLGGSLQTTGSNAHVHEELEPQQENERPDNTDTDSAYDSESLLGDDTLSLASYITEYRYEHGRRYHAYSDGAYWGPNDERSSDIQDLAHHVSSLRYLL
jgi:hypothetical protein